MSFRVANMKSTLHITVECPHCHSTMSVSSDIIMPDLRTVHCPTAKCDLFGREWLLDICTGEATSEDEPAASEAAQMKDESFKGADE